jgi:hypothetical protein
VYDPVADTWERKADMEVGRGLYSAEVVEGKAYLIGGTDKDYALLAAAPAAMPISAIPHNLISAGITRLRGGKESEEPVFFLLALFGCPAAFAVGAIGTIVILIKSLSAK